MKSKTEKTKLEKDPTNPSRRNAILTTGAGVVAAVGGAGRGGDGGRRGGPPPLPRAGRPPRRGQRRPWPAGH